MVNFWTTVTVSPKKKKNLSYAYILCYGIAEVSAFGKYNSIDLQTWFKNDFKVCQKNCWFSNPGCLFIILDYNICTTYICYKHKIAASAWFLVMRI